jgi:Xaa-Pro aminopeptidase
MDDTSRPGSGLRGYAAGPFSVDWEERIDFRRLREQRVVRAREQLVAAGVDAILVWKNENVRYLTSLRAQLLAGKESSLNGALLTARDGPILFCSGGELDKARSGMPWLAGIHPIPIMEQPELTAAFATATLKPLLEELGLRSGRLGIDHASFSLIEAVRRTLPDFELVDADAVMQAARLIKLDEEIAVIEEACAIGDAVAKRAIDESREGRRETEIAGDAMQTLYHLGGELSHVLTPYVASGEHMAPPHRITTDKVVRNGDLVFADIGAMWNGYFADIGRTTVVGKPRIEQKRVYTAVYESLMAGIAVMRPGNTTGDVANAIRAKVAEHDLVDHLFSLFIGHGIGIGSNEPPYIGESLPGATDVVLQPNMVFAVEPLVWLPDIPGGAGVRIEDMILITDGDPRVLSRVEYEDRLLL